MKIGSWVKELVRENFSLRTEKRVPYDDLDISEISDGKILWRVFKYIFLLGDKNRISTEKLSETFDELLEKAEDYGRENPTTITNPYLGHYKKVTNEGERTTYTDKDIDKIMKYLKKFHGKSS